MGNKFILLIQRMISGSRWKRFITSTWSKWTLRFGRSACHNTFSTRLHSQIRRVDFGNSRALAAVDREQRNSIMNALNGQKGVKAIYDAMFERHAHDVLIQGNRSLNLRIVRRDGKQKDVYATTTFPTYEQQNASRIKHPDCYMPRFTS